MGGKFGDAENPLLVSCRSGARASMPGMMDTVLNIGLNDATVAGPDRADRQRALRLGLLPPLRADVRRRRARPEAADEDRDRPVRDALMDELKHERGVKLDTELDADDLQELVARVQGARQGAHGQGLPRRPARSSCGAPSAPCSARGTTTAPSSIASSTASPTSWGTAVNVWSMVFGNMGDDSGTGVAFTRDPATGENVFYGEYLINAQGEDVVAGIRTPQADRRAASRRCPPSTRELRRDPAAAREALPRRAGHRVHDPAGQALDAAEPQRQAHRLRGGAHRRRHGRREADHAEARRCCASSPSALNQLLQPIFDPDAKTQAARGAAAC